MGEQVGRVTLFPKAFQGPRVMGAQPTSSVTSEVAPRVAIPVIREQGKSAQEQSWKVSMGQTQK